MTSIDTQALLNNINFDMMKEALFSYLLTLWDKDPVILGGIIFVVFMIISLAVFKMLFRFAIIAVLLSMTISFISPETSQPAFLSDIKAKLYSWLLEANSAYNTTPIIDVNSTTN